MTYRYQTLYRRSDKGWITTEKYAKKHPDSTEKERVRVPVKRSN